MGAVMETSGVEIAVLGPLEVRVGPPIEMDRRSLRRLLSIFALDAGQRITTDTLIDRFWNGEPPDTAKAAIQTYISTLRRLLGADVIVTEGYGYRLNDDQASVDVSTFLLHSRNARACAEDSEWSEALDAAEAGILLWRGRPFEDLDGDHFAQPEIARLSEVRMNLLGTRTEALLGLGRPGEALVHLEALVVEHPLREQFWELLMTSRQRMGRNAEALRAYRELSDLLGEIGLVPGERIRRLEEKILLQEQRLSGTVHNLPAELTEFIGRDLERKEALQLLSDHRLVTLAGAGGSGKTRLAMDLGLETVGSFPDGVWFVDLGRLHDPDLVPAAVAGALGLRPHAAEVMDVVVGAVAPDNRLIILDNCEHVLPAAAEAAKQLVGAGPGIKVLTTSREPLGVPGEAILEVPGMSFPSQAGLDMDTASEFDSVRLFVERSRQVRSSFTFDSSNVNAVVSICNALDGMPLAIELAAARTRSLAPEVIAGRLEDRFDVLGAGSSEGPARQQTLGATIEWSYELLAHSEQAVLNSLSVFEGGFVLEAAVEVASAVEPGDVVPIVSALVEKSLVTVDWSQQNRRYRLLETIRQYAADRLIQTGDVDAVRDRHLGWCVEAVKDLWSVALGAGQGNLIPMLDREVGNLEEALDWAESQHDDRSTVRLGQALGWHWNYQGYLTRATASLKRAIRVASGPDELAPSQALLAWTLIWSEDMAGALAAAGSAYEQVPDVEDPLIKVWITAVLGQCTLMSTTHEPEPVLRMGQESLDIGLESGDTFAEIRARQLMAEALCWNGRTREGLEHQRIVLELAAASRDIPTIQTFYGVSFFNFYYDLEARRGEIARVAEEWLELLPPGLEPMGLGADWLPWIYAQSGDFQRAEKAVAALGARPMEGWSRTSYLMARSLVSWMEGSLDDAWEAIEEMGAAGVNPRWAHNYYPLRAQIAADLGNLEEVRAAAETYTSFDLHTTEQATKLGVLGPLVRAEVDAALIGSDGDDVGSAEAAVLEMRRILDEHPPRTEGWDTPLTHDMNLVFAEAELARLTESDPLLWAEAQEIADYAYHRLYARWRMAEAMLAADDLEAGATTLREVHAASFETGTELLTYRVTTTAQEYSVDLPTN